MLTDYFNWYEVNYFYLYVSSVVVILPPLLCVTKRMQIS